MILRQLHEPLSNTYTYLIGCPATGEAVLIDPAYPTWERDLDMVRSLGLRLAYTLETHVHADHITSALKLREQAGSRIVFPAPSAAQGPDIALPADMPLTVGGLALQPLPTPGHTDDHFAYRLHDRVFTGDALLIDGCGRTDFQNGDAGSLYDSVHHCLFTLPDATLVYPAHDYNNRHVSTILQEKERNPRLGGDRNLEDFVELMNNLDLAYPKFIDYAVPGNRRCGVCPDDLPERLEAYCEQMTHSPQG